MKLELGVVVLNNEVAIFQATKPSQSNTINLTLGLLIYRSG